MVSSSAILSSVVALASWAAYVHGHGYMYIPLAEFKDKTTSEWIVQIEPQWEGEWEGDDEHRVEVYKTLAAERNVTNLRSFMDDDTSLYGAECGYTDPDVDAKDIPTDNTATLSRGIVHAGPCEIWLDDTMVMYNDDCQAAYGGEQDIKSVFPVDYSSCSSSGCMLRFYWLALQGIDGEVVWQVYKDCVPLKGGSGGSSTSTTTSAPSSGSSDAEATEAPATEAPETESSASDEAEAEAETEAPETEAPETEAPETEAPETEAPEAEATEAPATETPAAETPSSDDTASTPSKCSVRSRKRD